jgi:preprotein translocase subunit SecY
MTLQSAKVYSLRQRLILTLVLLTIVHVGCFIPVPYIDRENFANLFVGDKSSMNPVVGILNTFSGGGTSSFGLLSLGILPYLNASIIMQLVATASPSLAKLQKEEGEYGRRKLTEYTRYLTFIWAIIDSIGVTYSLRSLVFDWNVWTSFQIGLSLISGSMIVLWFSELITRDGLGNGSSLLICFNIVASLPDQLKTLAIALQNKSSYTLFLLAGIFLLTTLACVLLNEAIVKIPLVSAWQLLKITEKDSYWENTTLPLRLNQVGVMPLVFTSSVMVILSSFARFLTSQLESLSILSISNSFQLLVYQWVGKILFWVCYGVLIFFFTSFYSTIILDPKEVAEQFRKNSVIIKGLSPGLPTEKYLKETLERLSRINAIILMILVIFINGLESWLNIGATTLRGFGLTSQIILVNVLIDTLRRISSLLNAEEVRKNAEEDK